MIPFVTINLDKPRRLRFGYLAIQQFEAETGIKIEEVGSRLDFETATKAIWIMLRLDEPELTLEETKRLIDEEGDDMSLADVCDLAGEAITLAFKRKENPNKHPAAKK